MDMFADCIFDVLKKEPEISKHLVDQYITSLYGRIDLYDDDIFSIILELALSSDMVLTKCQAQKCKPLCDKYVESSLKKHEYLTDVYNTIRWFMKNGVIPSYEMFDTDENDSIEQKEFKHLVNLSLKT